MEVVLEEQQLPATTMPPCLTCVLRLAAALIQNQRGPDGNDAMDVVPMEQQLPGQRDVAAATTRRATAAWWQDGHPGWMIFTLGGRHFSALDEIIQVPTRTTT